MGNVTAYLCPDPWQPGGLKVRTSSQARIQVEKDDSGITTVTVPLVSDTAEPAIGASHEVTGYLIEQGHDELDALLCGTEREDEIHPSHRKVLDSINTTRQNSPLECQPGLGCSPLIYHKDLTYAAQVHASDMYLRAYHSPVTPEGLDGSGRIANAGVNAVQSEMVAAEVFIKEPRLTDAIIKEAMDIFFTPPNRIHMMNYLFTHAGFALFYDATEGAERWIFVVCLAWIEETESEEIEDNSGTVNCITCSDRLTYGRKKYHTVPGGRDVIPSDIIHFQWQNPLLCNLREIQVIGTFRGLRFSFHATEGGTILPHMSKSEVPVLGGRRFDEPLVVDPFPGEYFQILGWLDGYEGNCNPIMIASGFFVHHCFTSGVISSIILVENGTIEEELTIGSTPDSWIGEEGLAYKVECEGRLLTVISSDFARYSIGDRVMIQKGGITTRINAKGQEETQYGCQDPAKGTELTLLSNQTVRSFQSDGFILPQRFWNLGG